MMLQADLRKNKRFELRLPIELLRISSDRVETRSETRNMSSGGVLFLSGERLPVGEPIEYLITLPTSGKEVSSVRLHCMGTVIRLEARTRKGTTAANNSEPPYNVAATLERYEFVRVGKG
jgi:hypothetical protein